jgi:hypothetical protein
LQREEDGESDEEKEEEREEKNEQEEATLGLKAFDVQQQEHNTLVAQGLIHYACIYIYIHICIHKHIYV